jgi:hypothetical protein
MPTGLADGLATIFRQPLQPEHRLIRPDYLGSPSAAAGCAAVRLCRAHNTRFALASKCLRFLATPPKRQLPAFQATLKPDPPAVSGPGFARTWLPTI